MLWTDHLSRFMMMPFIRVVHSMITSHVILHIRRQTRQGDLFYLEDGQHVGLPESLGGDNESIGPIQFRRSSLLASLDGEY
ncbi:hypothetical protein K435DRAFT_878717 [Dendrothele bispora CBS 962.96]|uniref:Uncharacterized protein n=1 Tax=Dendrothele bispora (strain CBS 962.96) TaxID=1314807 RepID=A0A4S8KMM2_DENBC|nr:hypothetical protein K435DRAFT_878717 [Dendrothele bispora CBS 962.96]